LGYIFFILRNTGITTIDLAVSFCWENRILKGAVRSTGVNVRLRVTRGVCKQISVCGVCNWREAFGAIGQSVCDNASEDRGRTSGEVAKSGKTVGGERRARRP